MRTPRRRVDRFSGPSLSMLFVGSFSPETVGTPSLSATPAGENWQRNLLDASSKNGKPFGLVIAQRPMSAFPRSKTLIARMMSEERSGYEVVFPAFVNLLIIRAITFNLSTLVRFARWSWHQRRSARVVMHFNLTHPVALPIWLACKATGTLFVPFINDIQVPGDTVPDTPLRRLEWTQHRFLLPRLEGFVAVSDAIRRDFAGPANSGFLLLDGGAPADQLDFGRVRLTKLKRSAPLRRFTVIYAGRLDRVNGIPILLQAFRGLSPRSFALLIAGAGPLQGLTVAAAQASRSIQYLGQLTQDDLYEVYRDVDAAICFRPTSELSTDYFFPSKVHECLAMGLPLLVTSTGHTVDEYGEYVNLIQEESVNGIQKAVVDASQDRGTLSVRAHAGLEYMADNKTWTQQAERVAEFVESLLTPDDDSSNSGSSHGEWTGTPNDS